MFRKVIGKVYKTDDTPWLNTFITFKRTSGNYLNNIQYPPDVVRAKTDNQGNICKLDNSLGVDLWVNETGEKISNYQCLLPNDIFSFSIPIGNGAPIELSVLRAGSQPVEEYPQSVIDYIDDLVLTVTPSEPIVNANEIDGYTFNIDSAVVNEELNYQSFTPTANQNDFILSSTPKLPGKTRFFLNGVKQQYGVDYVINANVLNWLDIPLKSNYILEIYY